MKSLLEARLANVHGCVPQSLLEEVAALREENSELRELQVMDKIIGEANAKEIAALREENARLKHVATEMTGVGAVAEGLARELKEARAHVAALVQALQRMHDESSVLRRDGKRLNLGPMMEPSEAAVLEARKLLDAPDLKKFLSDAEPPQGD